MDLAVVTAPMQLNFREICRQLLLLAAWKWQKTVLPPPVAMREAASQFATQETGMQGDEPSRKSGHWLP